MAWMRSAEGIVPASLSAVALIRAITRTGLSFDVVGRSRVIPERGTILGDLEVLGIGPKAGAGHPLQVIAQRVTPTGTRGPRPRTSRQSIGVSSGLPFSSAHLLMAWSRVARMLPSSMAVAVMNWSIGSLWNPSSSMRTA